MLEEQSSVQKVNVWEGFHPAPLGDLRSPAATPALNVHLPGPGSATRQASCELGRAMCALALSTAGRGKNPDLGSPGDRERYIVRRKQVIIISRRLSTLEKATCKFPSGADSCGGQGSAHMVARRAFSIGRTLHSTDGECTAA